MPIWRGSVPLHNVLRVIVGLPNFFYRRFNKSLDGYFIHFYHLNIDEIWEIQLAKSS